jgi:hypothetical protein
MGLPEIGPGPYATGTPPGLFQKVMVFVQPLHTTADKLLFASASCSIITTLVLVAVAVTVGLADAVTDCVGVIVDVLTGVLAGSGSAGDCLLQDTTEIMNKTAIASIMFFFILSLPYYSIFAEMIPDTPASFNVLKRINRPGVWFFPAYRARVCVAEIMGHTDIRQDQRTSASYTAPAMAAAA